MSNYTNPSHPAEYGGGGSTGANYYDPRADFSSSQPYQQPSQQQHSQSHQQSQYGGGGNYNYDPTFSDAYKQARYVKNNKDLDNDDDDDDDEDSSIFKRALGFLSENKDRDDDNDINEQQVVGAHRALYGNQSGPVEGERKLDANFLGGGAAVQALKMFTSGEGKQSNAGAGDQNKLIGLAMAQAGKLWEQQSAQGKVVCILLPSTFKT